jgi:hypothetical protein
MVFLIGSWRIKSHEYGYIVQHKIGQQWKRSSYFITLEKATQYLIERKIHDESLDIIISDLNKAMMSVSRARLIAIIEKIRSEVLEVLGNDPSHN